MELTVHSETSGSPGIASGRAAQALSRLELERALVEVWMLVFQTDRVGLNDNFFELGGNSLLGLDLTELLASRLGIQIPVVAVFQYPTVHDMTEMIFSDLRNSAGFPQ